MKFKKIVLVALSVILIGGCGTDKAARIASVDSAQKVVQTVAVEKEKTRQSEHAAVGAKFTQANACMTGKDVAQTAVCFMGLALLDKSGGNVSVSASADNLSIPVLPEGKSAIREGAEFIGAFVAPFVPVLNTYVASYYNNKNVEAQYAAQKVASEFDFKKS